MTLPNLREERLYWKKGYRHIAGLDEAGRGAWAGPVVAGAVILPEPTRALARRLRQVNDSKQLTPAQRERLLPMIADVALAWAMGMADAREIDALGIVPATHLAMQRALANLAIPADGLLIDALTLPAVSLPQRVLVRGDARCLSIAAASIVAKVTRDHLMVDLDVAHAGYGFAQHKGYGTPQHRRALERLGACAIHRQSFAPVRRTFRP